MEEETQDSRINPLRAWEYPQVAHGFVGRLGGVSQGPYATLNLSSHVGDRQEDVDVNWGRLRKHLPRHSVVSRLNQVHGKAVHIVAEPEDERRPRADGMVTALPGVILGIMTADCVPVLMVDRSLRAVGALHAGWRGIIAGIAAEGIDAMGKLGASPDAIRVAMGPAIGQCCFEVDRELAERFVAEIRSSRNHVRQGGPGKAYLDLKGILTDQFRAAGVGSDSISAIGPCTRCASDRYFSRRAAGGQTSGLQMSFIGLQS